MPQPAGSLRRNNGVLLSLFMLYLVAIQQLSARPIAYPQWPQRLGMPQGVQPSLQQPKMPAQPALAQPNAFNGRTPAVGANWNAAASAKLNQNKARVTAVGANWNGANPVQPNLNIGAARSPAVAVNLNVGRPAQPNQVNGGAQAVAANWNAIARLNANSGAVSPIRGNVSPANGAFNGASAEIIANRIIGNRLPAMAAGSITTFQGQGGRTLPNVDNGRSPRPMPLKPTPAPVPIRNPSNNSPSGSLTNARGSELGGGGSRGLTAAGGIGNGQSSSRSGQAVVPRPISPSGGRSPGPAQGGNALSSSSAGGRAAGGLTYSQIANIAGRPVPGTPGAGVAFAGERPASNLIPSFNTMYSKLNRVVKPDEVIFFTGNTRAVAQQLQNQGRGTLITDLLKRGGIDETMINRMPGSKNDNGNEFFARASAALGQSTKGSVKVTMPVDFKRDGSSFFEKFELPFLRSNPNVREVRGLKYQNDGRGGWIPAGEEVLYSNPNARLG